MADILKQFYLDTNTKDSVKEFILVYLKDKAVEMTFSGEDTKHIKLAREVLDEAWNKLEQVYGKKEEKKKENPAR